MKKTLKILAIFIGLVVVFLIYVQFTFKQKFETPLTGIKASSDSSIIARGKYLVGPAHCYACHTSDSLKKLGSRAPLIGGTAFKTPFATFYTPNITQDKETGIGNNTDEELARAIRYNVNHRSEAMVGFMSYNNMSDDDITAIVSYLRTVSPVKHQVPSHDYNIIGKILMRFLIKPYLNIDKSELKPDSTVAYGKYLAYSVAQCHSCHTERDNTGQLIGQPFAGGSKWEYDDATYLSPNLTPHDSTGRIAKWDEQTFIQRFRAGKILENSPMPWEGYQHLSDSDLKALYRFLKSLPPVKREVNKTYLPKKAMK